MELREALKCLNDYAFELFLGIASGMFQLQARSFEESSKRWEAFLESNDSLDEFSRFAEESVIGEAVAKMQPLQQMLVICAQEKCERLGYVPEDWREWVELDENDYKEDR